MDPFIIRSAITVIVLISASIQDIRYREVKDIHWWLLGILSLVPMHDASDVLIEICRVTGTLMMMVCMMTDAVERMPRASLAITSMMSIIPLFIDAGGYMMFFISAPVCCLLYYLMYRLGILTGGADTKCMIVLSLLYPMTVRMMPFSMLVLLISSALTVLSFIPSVMRNLINGERGHLTHMRMDVEEAKRAFVWPLEEDDKGVWVRPMVPFIAFILAGFVITTVLMQLL